MEDIQYPALEVGDNQVYPGQELVGVLGGTLNAGLVVVAQREPGPGRRGARRSLWCLPGATAPRAARAETEAACALQNMHVG